MRGLDADGFIAREGSPDRVPPSFRPVVGAARSGLVQAFAGRLHSAYLYGSVPRGTAVVGRSDLDLAVALHHPPTEADRAAANRLDATLDGAFPQVDGVGTLLFPAAAALAAAERYDLGWTVACLCTPIAGDDLARRLPRYRPSSELARETNGDLERHLSRWRERLGRGGTTSPGASPGSSSAAGSRW